jgi:hypothetical protein
VGIQVQPPIAVTSAAQVPITAKTFARYVEIAEDGSGSATGLKVTWPNGSVSEYTPAMQPIKIGTIDGSGPLVGSPLNYNGPSTPATVYCNVESMGAATEVRVTEIN